MAIQRTQTLRGALAGAVAACVWVAQQPLDKQVFGVDYDDVELLGKAVTRGPGWVPAGLGMHIGNGALFGALYANFNERLPLPSWARGPFAALGEHALTWPLTILVERVHPARKELPALASNPRALAQATWRHLLFGVVLGELERRLNREPEAELPTYEAVVSSNGHGSLEQAVASS